MQIFVIDALSRRIKHRTTVAAVTDKTMNGSFVFPALSNVSIDLTGLSDIGFTQPSTVVSGGLVDQALNSGLLATTSVFSSVKFDSFMGISLIDTSNSTNINYGKWQTTSIRPGGEFISDTIAMGSTPAAVMAYYPIAYWVISESDGGAKKTYTQVTDPDADLVVSVSTNNGGDYTEVAYGTITAIPVGEQGSNLKIKLSNTRKIAADRVRVFPNWWAVLY